MKKSGKQKSQSKEQARINDLIFRELIKRGHSMEGKSRVWNIADSKLWYLTPAQSQAFLDLEKYDIKQIFFFEKEIGLIRENFKILTQEIKNKKINVVDLGCGDGNKALFFIKGFKDASNIRYCPIDISSFMVNKSLNTLSAVKNLQIIKKKNNLIDFFNLDDITSSLRKDSFDTNFLLLLGGSLENSDIHQLMHNIRTSMRDNDYLLIGNKLTHPDHKKMVDYYNKSKYVRNLFLKTIQQIGINEDEVEYGARFKVLRVEMFYKFKVDKTIRCNNKKVDFKAGDKLIVAISYKYTKDRLLECLNLYFSSTELYTSKDGAYALVLCKK